MSLAITALGEVAYEETEHYTLTKSFLDYPQAFLRHLVGKSMTKAVGRFLDRMF